MKPIKSVTSCTVPAPIAWCARLCADAAIFLSSSLPLLLNTTTNCSYGHIPRWPRYSDPTRPPALHFLHSRCALPDPISTDAIEAAARVRPRVRVPRLPRPARLLLLPPLYLPYFELPFDCLFQFRFNIHTCKKIEMFHWKFRSPH